MLALLLTAAAIAGPDPERLLRPERELSHGTLDATAHLGLAVWREVVSPGDGARCPMRPSCSAYARQAFRRDGLGGYILTFDRLLRDSAAAAYPLAPDGAHHLDPLRNHPPAAELLGGVWCRRQRADGAELCL